MTTFYLIRHASHTYESGRIAGRQEGVRLSPLGREQADALAEQMSRVPLGAVYCSPLERTRETATLIADRHGLQPVVREELIELGFGDWTGRTIAELKEDDLWKRFNAFRSGTRAPNGELMLETQLRIVDFMVRFRNEHPNASVAMVCHGDVVRSALAYFLGTPMDLFLRIEVDLASVSVVALGDYNPRILGVNLTGTIPTSAYEHP